MSDTLAIDQVFRVLRAQVPGQHPEINNETAEVWLAQLRQWPHQVLTEAALSWGAMHFPTLGEFRDHVEAVGRRLAEREREALRAGQITTVACPECGDREGWVPEPGTQRQGYDVPLRPCSRCNPRGFWLWRNGHTGPNHTCVICRATAKGNTEPLAEAMRAARAAPIEATAVPGDF
jgi:hypothetical protein